MNTLEKLNMIIPFLRKNSEYADMAQSIAVEVEDMMEQIKALKNEIEDLDYELKEEYND